jgi:2'-5' RNA ligase
MERIFIAIDFFKEVQESLERLRAPLDFARWTHPQDLHLTLNFIGDVQIQQTHEIVHFLEEIDFTSFRLRPKGVDVFGPLERPKSLFANVQSDEYLLQLQELIGQQMAKAMPGIARDKRRFLPHITLARFQFAIFTGQFSLSGPAYRDQILCPFSFAQ